jgi:hypothetical protein
MKPKIMRIVGVLDIDKSSISEGLLKLIRNKAWSCEDPEPNKDFNFYEIESLYEDVQNQEIEDVSDNLKKELSELYNLMISQGSWWARFY